MTNCMTNSSPSVLRIRRGTNCKVAHVGQAGCWRDIDDVRRDIVTGTGSIYGSNYCNTGDVAETQVRHVEYSPKARRRASAPSVSCIRRPRPMQRVGNRITRGGQGTGCGPCEAYDARVPLNAARWCPAGCVFSSSHARKELNHAAGRPIRAVPCLPSR
jgi:hypothetical protein